MKFSRVIGVDVASKKLDVFNSATGKRQELKNTREAVMRFAKSLGNPKDSLVVCEATGAYEHSLCANDGETTLKFLFKLEGLENFDVRIGKKV